MIYITAFAAAVPTEKKDDYVAHINETIGIFKEHGAARCIECWGSEVPAGQVTSFPMAVKCEPEETVVIGFIEWPSKAIHDEGMPRVMGAMEQGMKAGTLREPPFDGRRMIFGGFDVVAES